MQVDLTGGRQQEVEPLTPDDFTIRFVPRETLDQYVLEQTNDRVATGSGREVVDTVRSRRSQIIQGVISLIVVVAIFWFVLPKIADFGEVWRTIKAMTGLEIGVLAAVAAFNIWTYLPLNMSVLPGLRMGEAFVANNASTAVANTLPAGGALGVGVNFAFFRSWGFENAAITLALLVAGVLNTFVKLGLPIVALTILVAGGDASGALVTAAAVGLLILIVAVTLFAAMLKTDALARRVGDGVGACINFVAPADTTPAGHRFRQTVPSTSVTKQSYSCVSAGGMPRVQPS